MNFLSQKYGWKKLIIAFNVLYAKSKKYVQLIFQNMIQIVESKLFF